MSRTNQLVYGAHDEQKSAFSLEIELLSSAIRFEFWINVWLFKFKSGRIHVWFGLGRCNGQLTCRLIYIFTNLLLSEQCRRMPKNVAFAAAIYASGWRKVALI